jgi:hypothetical protein
MIKLNNTDKYKVTNYGFDNLKENEVVSIYNDGRVFSHFIEKWLEITYPLKWIKGCKSYDFVDLTDEPIQYDEKTFTKRGCKFMPSNMIGQGRKFDKDKFIEHATHLTYIIVDNVDFPNILVRFIDGKDLVKEYPNGNIKFSERKKLFNL